MNTEILEKYRKFRNYFNVSMNYRRDADIRFNTFGSVIRVRDHPPPDLDKIIEEFGQKNGHLASKESKVNLQNMLFKSFSLIGKFQKSSAFVAQFISNCQAFSGR